LIGLLGELVSIGTLLAFVMSARAFWFAIARRTSTGRSGRRLFGRPDSGNSDLRLHEISPIDTWYRLLIWLPSAC
jgi:hypothetical protein